MSIDDALLFTFSHPFNWRSIMRNNATNFPNQNNNKFEGEPDVHAEFSSKRADGTTNTHPQERMRASGERKNDDSNGYLK
jgi:small acid-soluble spore protein K (minor)